MMKFGVSNICQSPGAAGGTALVLRNASACD